MRNREKWDKRFLDLAKTVSNWSKDQSTKVGAVIVDNRNIILGLGYNGFPRNINDNIQERNQRPNKYKFTIHAEENAILNSNQSNLINSTLYCTFFPCPNCMCKIINVGISRVVTIENTLYNKRWEEDFKISKEMAIEAGIELTLY